MEQVTNPLTDESAAVTLPVEPLPGSPDNPDDGSDGFRASLASALRGRNRDQDAPDIGHLADAITYDHVTGTSQVRVGPGDQIIIERRCSLSGGPRPFPWLDTRIWRVNSVLIEKNLLTLYDSALTQHGTSQWVSGLEDGNLYKIPPAKGRWDAGPPKTKIVPACEPVPVIEVRELGERANLVEKAANLGDPVQKKSGRGRPAGVKNRPREVIAAEKAELATKKAMKRAAKFARKGMR